MLHTKVVVVVINSCRNHCLYSNKMTLSNILSYGKKKQLFWWEIKWNSPFQYGRFLNPSWSSKTYFEVKSDDVTNSTKALVPSMGCLLQMICENVSKLETSLLCHRVSYSHAKKVGLEHHCLKYDRTEEQFSFKICIYKLIQSVKGFS